MTSVAGQGTGEGALVSVKSSLSHRRRPTARHAHNRALSRWQRLEDWLTVVCQKLSAPWQLKCFSAGAWNEKSNSQSECWHWISTLKGFLLNFMAVLKVNGVYFSTVN